MPQLALAQRRQPAHLEIGIRLLEHLPVEVGGLGLVADHVEAAREDEEDRRAVLRGIVAGRLLDQLLRASAVALLALGVARVARLDREAGVEPARGEAEGAAGALVLGSREHREPILDQLLTAVARLELVFEQVLGRHQLPVDVARRPCLLEVATQALGRESDVTLLVALGKLEQRERGEPHDRGRLLARGLEQHRRRLRPPLGLVDTVRQALAGEPLGEHADPVVEEHGEALVALLRQFREHVHEAGTEPPDPLRERGAPARLVLGLGLERTLDEDELPFHLLGVNRRIEDSCSFGRSDVTGRGSPFDARDCRPSTGLLQAAGRPTPNPPPRICDRAADLARLRGASGGGDRAAAASARGRGKTVAFAEAPRRLLDLRAP